MRGDFIGAQVQRHQVQARIVQPLQLGAQQLGAVALIGRERMSRSHQEEDTMSEGNRPPTKAEIHELIDKRAVILAGELGSVMGSMVANLVLVPMENGSRAALVHRATLTASAFRGETARLFARHFAEAVSTVIADDVVNEIDKP